MKCRKFVQGNKGQGQEYKNGIAPFDCKCFNSILIIFVNIGLCKSEHTVMHTRTHSERCGS